MMDARDLESARLLYPAPQAMCAAEPTGTPAMRRSHGPANARAMAQPLADDNEDRDVEAIAPTLPPPPPARFQQTR